MVQLKYQNYAPLILSTLRDGFAVDLLVQRRFADAVVVRRVLACPGDVLADWFFGDDNDRDSSDDEDAWAGFNSMDSRRHELCLLLCVRYVPFWR